MEDGVPTVGRRVEVDGEHVRGSDLHRAILPLAAYAGGASCVCVCV